jgi:hypothetical protein
MPTTTSFFTSTWYLCILLYYTYILHTCYLVLSFVTVTYYLIGQLTCTTVGGLYQVDSNSILYINFQEENNENNQQLNNH